MRKSGLYFRLAVTNLWKNRQTYLSFLLSAICTVFVFYTFLMIALNDGIKDMRGASSMQVMMWLGAVVVALFAMTFLFYANSFLMKRRKKELGLYAILGLEKKHIARILFHEMTLLLLVSVCAGIGLGMALGKLMFLLIQALMRIPTPILYQVTELPLILTAALFAGVFLCLLLYNRLQVQLSNPIKLLMGQQSGEKEPKTRWLLALIGVATMGAGYVIANMVGNPMEALTTFFIAVLLVIIGTYALFTAGSIALLKMLRRNKGYYYQPKNFVSVSGMIYRMKQNAAGLAGICVLSTMAIITIGTTAALYVGQESMLEDQFPMDHELSIQEGEKLASDAVESILSKAAADNQVAITELYTGLYTEMAAYQEGNWLHTFDFDSITTTDQYRNVRPIFFLPLSEYNRMTGNAYTLSAGEALVFDTRTKNALSGTVKVGDTSLQIKEELSVFPIAFKRARSMQSPIYLILPDREEITALLKSLNGPETETFFSQGYWWNVSGEEDNRSAYAQAVRDGVSKTGVSFSISSVDSVRREWYAMYGGFLFLGVFLGLLFLMATTLIIYFKQVSEGYMDHDRFIILQKVGMSRDEVKSTVQKQILSVFVLPLIVAGLHTTGALHMMTQLLAMFGLMNESLIAISIFSTAGVFALIYAAVYQTTAKTYYNLVRMNGKA